MAGHEPKKRFHEQIADQLIKQLEAGTAPWLKPWKPGEQSMPFNGISEKRYRGANSLWLAMQGRSDPRWMTYKQAQSIGAQVKKGEKGTLVQYWQFNEERPKLDAAGKPVIGKDGKPEKVTYELERPRVFNAVVFNGEQIDGLKPMPPRQKEPDWQVQERAEKVLQASGANIRNVHGDRAYYNSRADQITLPEKSQFDAPDKYYATALHELGHWTGHESRLNRDLANPFGSEAYAKEELRAEIASLMVGNELGVGHDPGQHAAYVGSWIKALKEDPLEIVRAASDAEKIMGLVMSYDRQQEQTQDRGNEQTAPDRSQTIQATTATELTTLQKAEQQYAAAQTVAEQAKAQLTAAEQELSNARDTAAAQSVGAFAELDQSLTDAEKLLSDWPKTEIALKEQEDRDRQSLYQAHAEGRISDAQFSEQSALLSGADYRESLLSDLIEKRDEAQERLDNAKEERIEAIVSKEFGAYKMAEKELIEATQREADAKDHLLLAEEAYRLSVARAGDSIDTGADTEQKIEDMLTAVQQTSPERTYLKSEFREKDEIKALGAKYDRQEKAWYVPPGMDVAPFTKWIPDESSTTRSNPVTTEKEPETQTTKDQGERTYLKSEFHEKDEIKALGAKYDRQEKAWYVPPGMDAAPFAKWLPDNIASPKIEAPESSTEQADQQAAQIREQERVGIFEQGKGAAPTAEQAAENAVHAAETKQAAEQAHKDDKVTYLAIPFTEKDEAKRAGARWNNDEKVWYAPPGAELSKLSQWLPGNRPVADNPAISARDEFKEALKNLGCLPDNDPKERHPIMDGKHHRIPVDGDKSGERSGFYFVHSDGRPAGFIQNHKTGETLNWKSQGTRVNKEQLAAARAEAAQKQAEREKERQQTQEQTAAKVTNQFAKLETITTPTPYMQNKGISLASASGLKAGQKNETVIPAQDVHGKHWTSQYIQEDGTKRFAKDSKKDGCFHPIGGMKSLEKAACIVICEGFATGASIKQAMPEAGVVVAFDSGNLSHVAKDIHARWPDKAKVIAGDDDAHAIMTHGKNVGREKAEAAAKEIGAVSVLPVFSNSEKHWPSDLPRFTPEEWRAGTITDEQKSALASYKKLTDFNDLGEKSVLGNGAVERQVGTAVSKALTQQQERETVRTQSQNQSQEEKRVQKRPMPDRQEGKRVRRSVSR